MIYPSSTALVLMGAGPGDPELITLKAWRLLQQATVVLYDRLANPALLDMVPADCEKIPVGKNPYTLTVTQQQIHDLIREKAKKGGLIVRLKGGDPFIFGRGFEEVLVAQELGIPVSYVPGITSMQAAGLIGIPLTHRGASDSIWILTGTKQDGSLTADLRLAIRSRATVVIYMGMKKLAEIAGIYREAGQSAIPAAIVQEASLPTQRMVIGKAGELAELAREHGFTNPSIIVIGDVVDIAQKARCDNSGPTYFKTVLSI